MEFEQEVARPKNVSQMTKNQLQCLTFMLVEHTNEDADNAPSWWPTSLQFHHPYIGELNSSFKQVRRELIYIIKSFIAYNKDHDWFLEAFRFATRSKDASDNSTDKSLNNTNAVLLNNNNVENKIAQNNSMMPLLLPVPVKIDELEKDTMPPQVLKQLLSPVQEHIPTTQVSKRLLATANNKQPKKKRKIIEDSINIKLSILKKLLPAVTVNVYDVVKYGCPENKDDFLSTLNLMKSNALDKLNGIHSRKLRNKSSLVRHCLPIGFDEEYKNKIARNSYIRNSPRMVSIVTNQVIPISPLRHNDLTRLSFPESTRTTAKVPGPFEAINETPLIISDSENDSIIVSISNSSDSKENKICNSSNRRECILQDRAAFSSLELSDESPTLSQRKHRKYCRRRLLENDKIVKSKKDLFIQKQISNYFLPSSNLQDKFLSNKKVNLLKDQCKPCFVKLFPLLEIKQNNSLIHKRKSISSDCECLNPISDDEDAIIFETLSNSSMEVTNTPEIVQENDDSDTLCL